MISDGESIVGDIRRLTQLARIHFAMPGDELLRRRCLNGYLPERLGEFADVEPAAMSNEYIEMRVSRRMEPSRLATRRVIRVRQSLLSPCGPANDLSTAADAAHDLLDRRPLARERANDAINYDEDRASVSAGEGKSLSYLSDYTPHAPTHQSAWRAGPAHERPALAEWQFNEKNSTPSPRA